MGNISLEQIDLIMQRANVTYSEAKEALEKCNGDTLEALVLLEKEQKIKTAQHSCSDNSKFKETVKGLVHKLNATRFILKKEDRTYINIPLSVALIIILCSFYISILGLIIAYCCGFKIDIEGENDIAQKLNEGLDFIKKQ